MSSCNYKVLLLIPSLYRRFKNVYMTYQHGNVSSLGKCKRDSWKIKKILGFFFAWAHAQIAYITMSHRQYFLCFTLAVAKIDRKNCFLLNLILKTCFYQEMQSWCLLCLSSNKKHQLCTPSLSLMTDIFLLLGNVPPQRKIQYMF